MEGLERLTVFFLQDNPIAAEGTADLIIEAMEMLGNHPSMGRAVEKGLREFVISRDKSDGLNLVLY